jgi:uncharacterized membrane protein HdeD (DUF308 family)
MAAAHRGPYTVGDVLTALSSHTRANAMSTLPDPSAPPEVFGLHELRQRWWILLVFGAVIIFLGLIFLSAAYVVAVTIYVTVFGFLLIFSGAAQVAQGILTRRWGGFLLHLLLGLLDVLIGVIFIRHPDFAADLLAMLLTFYLIIGGVSQIATAAIRRYPHRIWLYLAGGVTVVLGCILLSGLIQLGDDKNFGELILGTFIGVSLLFNGVSLVMLSLAVRRLPDPAI